MLILPNFPTICTSFINNLATFHNSWVMVGFFAAGYCQFHVLHISWVNYCSIGLNFIIQSDLSKLEASQGFRHGFDWFEIRHLHSREAWT